MKSFILLAAFGVLFSVACNTVGEPMDFANACKPENDKKYIEVSGVFTQQGRSVFCSNIGGGRLECGFDLLESAGGQNRLRVDVAQGSGSNAVEKLESGYKKEDIKIRDNAGNLVALDADRVKVTGKVSVAPPTGNASGICFMQIEKIEK
ncbi:MAG: hypothetical protein ABL984_02230 [Pyrinomonadaceae bacterium]